tara:strand:- start:582 stop:743 length:162 start_codon:yes stop_codon:yes gene_type:complete
MAVFVNSVFPAFLVGLPIIVWHVAGKLFENNEEPETETDKHFNKSLIRARNKF